MNDDDLKRLQTELLLHPDLGDIMQGTGGVRKLRFAYEHRGKSGSVRVVYAEQFEEAGQASRRLIQEGFL